jgi:hypothetical protein
MRSILIRCYPAGWRTRYGDEFAALLEQTALGPLDVADILIGALDAQLRLRGRETDIARGRGFIVSLRVGGIAAILGAVSWAVAGLVNAGALGDSDVVLPSIMLAAALPIWLVAMAGLSAFQARTNPVLSWMAFWCLRSGRSRASWAWWGSPPGRQLFWVMFASVAGPYRQVGPVRDRHLSNGRASRGAAACLARARW